MKKRSDARLVIISAPMGWNWDWLDRYLNEDPEAPKCCQVWKIDFDDWNNGESK